MAASTAKGTAWETSIVNWLRPRFSRAERRARAGAKDKGDIAGLAGVVIEAKHVKPSLLSVVFNVGLKELAVEVDNANAHLGLLCVKRPGTTDPGACYWLLDPRHVQDVIQWAEERA
jgi:hypothetical protein